MFIQPLAVAVANQAFPVNGRIQNISQIMLVSKAVSQHFTVGKKKKVFSDPQHSRSILPRKQDTHTKEIILNNSIAYIFSKARNLQKGLNETIHIIIIIFVSKHWHCYTLLHSK